MRICLVSREFAPYFGAGIGTYASQMAAAWAGAGHETHILTAPHPALRERAPALRPGVHFHTTSPESGVAALDAYRFDFRQHAMAVYESLQSLHARHPFNYIEFPEYWAEGYFALRARRTGGDFGGAVLGVRLHTPTRDCRALNREDWLDEEIATLEHSEESGIREADVIVSPTRSLLERVTGALGLPGDAGSAVIPYPFDAASIAELGTEAAYAAATPTILYFGRFEQRKGVHLLIHAAAHLMKSGIDMRLRLIGRDTDTGPHGRSYLGWLRRSIPPEFRERFSFEPARPRAALGAAIRGATACCFPSLWENFPNACLEAMSLGVPVVGSDAGGMGEIIRDGEDGLLFRSGDAASLAGALKRVLADQSLRTRLSDAAPRRIQELCRPADVVAAFERVITDVKSRPAPPPARIPSPQDAPLVSVIIPFFNLAQFLPRTLESLRAQTFQGFETILIDDGSTDEAAAPLLSDVERGRHGNIRLIRQPNGGLSAARNAGLAAASGRWVVPLDADDTLEPDFLSSGLEAAARTPGATFVTSLVRFFFETPDVPHGGWVPLGIDRDLLAFANCASSCTALIDREALVRAGGYDPWLTSYEDWDLWCRLALAGATGTVIPRFLINYRCRPDSMMRTEGRMRRDLLHACLIARHAALPLHPDRTMRLELARAAAGATAETRAQQLVEENIRYRVADRLNNVMKTAGVHRALKDIAVWLGASDRERPG